MSIVIMWIKFVKFYYWKKCGLSNMVKYFFIQIYILHTLILYKLILLLMNS